MTYAPDFVKGGECVLWTTLIPVGCLVIVSRLDKEETIVPNKAEWIRILGVCVTAGILSRPVNVSQTALETMLLDILIGCLLFASITDLYIGKAYNFIWWIGTASGLLIFWHRSSRMSDYHLAMLSISLFIFTVLQQIFFARFYGRADCHAFCVCAFAEGSLGMGMTAFLIHMVLAFGLLIIVQGSCCNIGKYGRLKRPVPFLPYITASFLIMMVW